MTKELIKAPESLAVWESNMKELRSHQPRLAEVLDEYVAEHGHSFAHFETTTPAGRWIEGLTDEPFFESIEEPKFEWSRKKKEDKDKPVFFQYGVHPAGHPAERAGAQRGRKQVDGGFSGYHP